MSERAPNPRLANFEANKAAAEAQAEADAAAAAEAQAAAEREEFEQALYGDAGTGDNPENYTDEAYNRVEEAADYEAHLERMASPDYVSTSLGDAVYREDGNGSYERIYPEVDISGVPNRAVELAGQEHEEALAMNEAFDEKKKADAEELQRAQVEALDAKLNAEGNAHLRQMDRISEEIHDLRRKEATPEAEEDLARLKELEDRLEELLERYSKSDDYDPALADVLIDRKDMAAFDKAAANALAEQMSAAEAPTATGSTSENEASAPGTPEPSSQPFSREDANALAAELSDDEEPKITFSSEDAKKLRRELNDDVLVAGGKPKANAEPTPATSEAQPAPKAETEPKEEDEEAPRGRLKRALAAFRTRRAQAQAERLSGKKDKDPATLRRKLGVVIGGAAIAAGAMAFAAGDMSRDEPPRKSDKATSAPDNRQQIERDKQQANEADAEVREKWAPKEGEYPWDVVHRVAPEADAMEALRTAVEQARADGNDVEIVDLENDKQSIKMGENDNPTDVMNLLAPYLSQSK